ncbi:MAG: LTA synthase family protein [Tissierellia bacterium]|nr:LTA synthase family protein [Tissierellia bacterium]
MKNNLINNIQNKHKTIFIYLCLILFVPLLFSLSIQFIQFENIAYTVNWILDHRIPFFMGYILIVLLYLALLCIGSFGFATASTGAISFVLAIINYYKCKFRNEPFLPWDLTSSSELKQIIPQLKIEPTLAIIFCILVYLTLIYFTRKIKIKKPPSLKIRIIVRTAAFFVILFIGLKYINITFFNDAFLNNLNISINNWEQAETYNNNGVVSAFVLNSANLAINVPDSYSKQKMTEINNDIKELTSKNNKNNIKKIKPNIIIIMSEGFWDVTNLPGINFENELLPTIKHLQDNYISGYNFSPKFGGGTSNVEFEALTGFANQFLPPNSVPYEQYILEPSFSIAKYLKNNGYSTLAIHSNNREFWNRNNAYKNLYFDNFIAADNFENPELKRGLISDMEVSQKIISEFEKNRSKNDKPLFNYTVTMQNHMAYSSDKWNESEIVKFRSNNLSNSVVDGLKDLATGLNYSDKALKYLIDYFEKIGEPTIIVFFGDHMNLLGDYTEQVFEETGYLKKGYTDLDKDFNLYRTPIVVWNNYTEFKCELGNISTFQLLPTVMDIFDLDMPMYYKYLNEIKNVSKGYARSVVLDELGNPSYNLNNNQKEIYNKFNMIQYDQMFGNQYSSDLFE